MATTKIAYSSWSSLTITLNSLTNSSARQSNVIDNTSNLYLDIVIGGSFKTASGSLGTNPGLNIWVAGLTYTDSTPTDHYGGSNGSNTLGGGDASFTMPSNTGNLRGPIFFPINTAAALEYIEPISLGSLFNGTPTTKFVIIVQNSTGLTLDSSAGGVIYYLGVTTTTV